MKAFIAFILFAYQYFVFALLTFIKNQAVEFSIYEFDERHKILCKLRYLGKYSIFIICVCVCLMCVYGGVHMRMYIHVQIPTHRSLQKPEEDT